MTEADWLSATDLQEMMQFLGARQGRRKLRLFHCACVRRAAALLANDRTRDAVERSERCADMEGDRDEVRPAGEDYIALRWLSAVTNVLFRLDPVAPGVVTGLIDRIIDGRDRARQRREGYRARLQMQAGQVLLLRCVYGNPFRPRPAMATGCLTWNNGTVRKLAESAYAERTMPEGTLDPARLALLADALEDAGCTDAELLGHLRGPGPHVRGCWALDLVLGKS
jgi:hypothetical protein